MHPDFVITELSRDRQPERSPGSPAAWALRAKNGRAALELLERRDALSWREASECASLALGRSAKVLAAVLDRAPRDDPLFCTCFTLIHGGTCALAAWTDPLTAAAALDDLETVELLLARGVTPVSAFFRTSPHFYELADIPSSIPVTAPDTIRLQFPDGGAVTRRPPLVLEQPDPLAAAVFCGATRCAPRLAALCRGPSPACRRAFVSAYACGGGFREAAEAVAAVWGAEPVDFLEASDFSRQPGGPLLPEFLRRHPDAVLPSGTVASLLADSVHSRSPYCWDALECLDPAVFTSALVQFLSRRSCSFRTWKEHYLRNLPEHPNLRLVLDRNAVPFELEAWVLSFLLDRARIVGAPPKGGPQRPGRGPAERHGPGGPALPPLLSAPGSPDPKPEGPRRPPGGGPQAAGPLPQPEDGLREGLRPSYDDVPSGHPRGEKL